MNEQLKEGGGHIIDIPTDVEYTTAPQARSLRSKESTLSQTPDEGPVTLKIKAAVANILRNADFDPARDKSRYTETIAALELALFAKLGLSRGILSRGHQSLYQAYITIMQYAERYISDWLRSFPEIKFVEIDRMLAQSGDYSSRGRGTAFMFGALDPREIENARELAISKARQYGVSDGEALRLIGDIAINKFYLAATDSYEDFDRVDEAKGSFDCLAQ